jgi:hypothetical protein
VTVLQIAVSTFAVVGSVGRISAVALPVAALQGCSGNPEDCERKWEKCCGERRGTPSKEGNKYICRKDLGQPWGEAQVVCEDTNGDGGISPATECKCQLWQPVPGGGWDWVDVPCSDFPDEDPRRNPGPLCRTFLNDCDP